MITVDEALRLIHQIEPNLEMERIPVDEAGGRVLAQPAEVREHVPRFDNAAMDGYAVRRDDLQEVSDEDPIELTRTGTAAAGAPAEQSLSPGETIRIFTGAPVPDGTTAVVMQEHVEVKGDTIRFTQPINKHNIRRRGEELKKGDTLLDERTVLNPASIGMLQGQGYTSVPVYEQPSIAIVNTGDELVDPSETPSDGQIRDSIGPALSVALTNEGYSNDRYRVADNREQMFDRFGRLLDEYDVLLVSGGVSVGDRDLTRPVLADLSVEQQFWKICQKPGKPLYLGCRDGTYVLGLPGNPVSSLVCFYLYGIPLVRLLSGVPEGERELSQGRTRLATEESNTKKRTKFVRARTERQDGAYVSHLQSHQRSHMLSGLAGANSLVRIPYNENPDENETYDVYFLPGRKI